jgi:dinuclear metal center YbgI/SA1388 family protein
MKIKEIVSYLEELIPPQLAEPWDNVGFQCGDKNTEVKKIVIALDPSEEAINYAIKKQAQLLVTHHPLIFSTLKEVVFSEPIGRLIIKMIEHGLNLFVLHTNLDNFSDGVSTALLSQLAIKTKGVIQPKSLPNIGLGRWGEMSEVIEAQNFIKMVKNKLQLPFIRAIGEKQKIKKVGVCGGSASELIHLALKQALDVFIIGEIKYHPARIFQKIPMLVLEIGHYESERFILPELKRKIEKFLNREKIEVFLFEEASPFKYY